ncbi:hypothetical protein BGW37DRAFT_170594 [Umbelopsis sp. PMI_123]|nr:hypothetical protein BGW37DRAFT_170594 [Umbelopsis sp. PMI_123]
MQNPNEQESLTGHEITENSQKLGFKEKLKQPRFWFSWIIRLVVFSLTGSLSVRITSLFVHNVLRMDGAFKDSAWFPYRIVFILCTLPIYSILIVTIGTLVGQYQYFSRIVKHTWSCFIPCLWRKRQTADEYEPIAGDV